MGAELFPSSPEPVRIDRFIEKRFRVTPRFEELGKGVLGFTKFGPAGVQEMVISRTLGEDESTVSRRRLNTTYAHEAGHGLLHSHLFILGVPAPSLFEGDPGVEGGKILCRDEAISEETPRMYDGRWWEYQANRAIGPLLLPCRLVEQCLGPLLGRRGSLGTAVLQPGRRSEAEHILSDVFDVNPVVARIRLERMFLEGDESQLAL